MTKRRLIINADDFGWSSSINEAVERAHSNGVLTSASIMAGGGAVEEAIRIAGRNPKLGLGLHLTLAQGKPLSEKRDIQSLCTPDGNFLTRTQLARKAVQGKLRPDDLRNEFLAQLNRLTSAGVNLTHIDSHQHIHVLPQVREVVLSEAKRLGLAVRIPDETQLWFGGRGRGLSGLVQLGRKMNLRFWAAGFRRKAVLAKLRANDHFVSPFGLLPPIRELTPAAFDFLLRKLKPGLTEMMVHPGLGDDLAEVWGGDPQLMTDRRTEARVLCSAGFKAEIDRLGLRLVNFSQA